MPHTPLEGIGYSLLADRPGLNARSSWLSGSGSKCDASTVAMPDKHDLIKFEGFQYGEEIVRTRGGRVVVVHRRRRSTVSPQIHRDRPIPFCNAFLLIPSSLRGMLCCLYCKLTILLLQALRYSDWPIVLQINKNTNLFAKSCYFAIHGNLCTNTQSQ